MAVKTDRSVYNTINAQTEPFAVFVPLFGAKTTFTGTDNRVLATVACDIRRGAYPAACDIRRGAYPAACDIRRGAYPAYFLSQLIIFLRSAPTVSRGCSLSFLLVARNLAFLPAENSCINSEAKVPF